MESGQGDRPRHHSPGAHELAAIKEMYGVLMLEKGDVDLLVCRKSRFDIIPFSMV